MNLTIKEFPSFTVHEYQSIPISFWVTAVFNPQPLPDGAIGFVLKEMPVETPYLKNYDDDIDSVEGLDWARRWDVSNWGFLGAYDGDKLIGCAAVAYETEGLNMLNARSDITVLWDIRVEPAYRGKGVGSALFDTAVTWSEARGVTGMKIETQNINVAACRFYASKGCVLTAVDTLAYPDLPNEIQLIWQLTLE